MKRIFLPSRTPSDWQHLLAQPNRQWKKSYSAMTTAACWEDSNNKLPDEILKLLEGTKCDILTNLRLLAAFPEYEVDLPGWNTSSQTDVLALARNNKGLVVFAVESKVDESFGPTLGKKRADLTKGLNERLNFLHSYLKLATPLDDSIRYQLLHRTVSSLKSAIDFHAGTAVMLVHSFSPTCKSHKDFVSFCTAINAKEIVEDVFTVEQFIHPRLYLCWCKGDKKYLEADFPSEI